MKGYNDRLKENENVEEKSTMKRHLGEMNLTVSKLMGLSEEEFAARFGEDGIAEVEVKVTLTSGKVHSVDVDDFFVDWLDSEEVESMEEDDKESH